MLYELQIYVMQMNGFDRSIGPFRMYVNVWKLCSYGSSKLLWEKYLSLAQLSPT